VLFGPSDHQLGLLAILQIWRDLFLGVSLAFIIICDDAGGRGKVVSLEQRCWSGGRDEAASQGLGSADPNGKPSSISTSL
jgi:hypothetical protein